MAYNPDRMLSPLPLLDELDRLGYRSNFEKCRALDISYRTLMRWMHHGNRISYWHADRYCTRLHLWIEHVWTPEQLEAVLDKAQG